MCPVVNTEMNFKSEGSMLLVSSHRVIQRDTFVTTLLVIKTRSSSQVTLFSLVVVEDSLREQWNKCTKPLSISLVNFHRTPRYFVVTNILYKIWDLQLMLSLITSTQKTRYH